MYRKYFLSAILFLALTIPLFAGCQAQNADVPTEPSVSSQPTEPSSVPTEPSSKVTEPSSEATDPTETVCPLTVEEAKAQLKPYMTYREAIAIFGEKDGNMSNSTDYNKPVWYLENDYYICVYFFPTVDREWATYLETIPPMPTDETKPDGTPLDSEYHFATYIWEWNDHMEAYKAVLYKGKTVGKKEVVETWFDYGWGPFWQEEE